MASAPRGGLAALLLIGTSFLPLAAWAQLPPPEHAAGATPAPPVEPSATGQAGAAASKASTVEHPHRHHHRRSPGKAASLDTVRQANDQARSSPTRGAYLNAALYYDYEPGRLYTVDTSPRFLTAIALRPGETIISKAAGDTVRWIMGETETGSGDTKQQLVMLKPLRGGLRTNIIITTDQHTYLLDAVSHEQDDYTTEVSWNYPRDQFREAQARITAQQASLVATNLSLDKLNFSYKIKVEKGRPPRWQPVRVFDDGSKTYVQFPADLASSEAPPFFLVGPHDTAELVNYRLVNGYYVVDRLFEVAELRIGETPQAIVRITRQGPRG